MTYYKFIKVFIFLTCYNIYFINFLFANEIKIESVIILDENIPKECGIKFMIDEKNDIEVVVSIKKTTNDSVYNLYILKKNKNAVMEKLNIKTDNLDLQKDIMNKKGTTSFFQELLISGGDLIIGSNSYKISGPIDSKVRLEYLFCTGEMYHPKYEK